MTKLSEKREFALFRKPPLLLTESRSEFDDFQASFQQAIMPRGAIEHIYFDDIVASTWEILRFRRSKTAIINSAFQKALLSLLEPHFEDDYLGTASKDLAERWFVDSAARKKVAQLLGRFELDEFAIEAEAIRISLPDLEGIDRLLATAEARRNRAFRNIEDCRASFARTARNASDRVLEANDGVTTLDHEPQLLDNPLQP